MTIATLESTIFFRRLASVLKRSVVPYKTNVYHVLKERAVEESADYAAKHLDDAMIFDRPSKLWNYVVSKLEINDGLVLEFGVFEGRSINHFAKLLTSDTLHGFDSFEGLAEDWTGYHLAKGAFDLGGKLPDVAANVRLHKGWFDQTLPPFLAENGGKLRLCHVDCDTYESSKFVLETVADRLTAGTVIVFDEYYGYPNWQRGEFLAWQEVCAAKGIMYQYIGFANMQAAVRIL